MAKEDKRKSDEHKQHLKTVGFQPGMKRHPNAGRKAMPDILKQHAADLAPEALKVIEELMVSADKDSVRLQAAQTILQIVVAKAARQHVVRHEHSVAELLHEINSGGKPMIDVTPDEDDEGYITDDYEAED